MIIYFSSTGNSKYVAKRIAEAENDWTRSVTSFDYGYPVEFKKKNVFGIVCPTYFGSRWSSRAPPSPRDALFSGPIYRGRPCGGRN